MPRGGPGKPRKKADARVRFFSFVQKDENGCWLWTGFNWKSGYANFWAEGRSWQAHAWAYKTFRGSVPEGLELDHQCNNPGCVNPWHLKPMTHKENVRKSNNVCGINARKVSCIYGHPFDADNTYVTPDGRRKCRLCRDAASARYVAKKAVRAGG